MLDWPVVALSGVTESSFLELFSMSPDSNIHIATDTGSWEHIEEHIDESVEGPERRGFLRSMRMIGKNLYATGMQRQVYRRIDEAKWQRMDQGILIPHGSDIITGFNSIDGFNEQDIYAVGFGGEIWHYNGRIWQQLDSPSNLILSNVKCVPPDTVYICGQIGTLLRGRDNQWEIIEHEVTTEGFFGLEWFQNKLYVASSNNIFILEDNSLKPIEILKDKEFFTSGHLHSNDGILLSVGSKHLVYTDGESWTEIICDDGTY
ncbi:MAG: hypothetical protein HC877_23745 [Thioploca sp.]|nr:hypothetical protein [Thioploca sp.]